MGCSGAWPCPRGTVKSCCDTYRSSCMPAVCFLCLLSQEPSFSRWSCARESARGILVVSQRSCLRCTAFEKPLVRGHGGPLENTVRSDLQHIARVWCLH